MRWLPRMCTLVLALSFTTACKERAVNNLGSLTPQADPSTSSRLATTNKTPASSSSSPLSDETNAPTQRKSLDIDMERHLLPAAVYDGGEVAESRADTADGPYPVENRFVIQNGELVQFQRVNFGAWNGPGSISGPLGAPANYKDVEAQSLRGGLLNVFVLNAANELEQYQYAGGWGRHLITQNIVGARMAKLVAVFNDAVGTHVRGISPAGAPMEYLYSPAAGWYSKGAMYIELNQGAAEVAEAIGDLRNRYVISGKQLVQYQREYGKAYGRFPVGDDVGAPAHFKDVVTESHDGITNVYALSEGGELEQFQHYRSWGYGSITRPINGPLMKRLIETYVDPAGTAHVRGYSMNNTPLEYYWSLGAGWQARVIPDEDQDFQVLTAEQYNGINRYVTVTGRLEQYQTVNGVTARHSLGQNLGAPTDYRDVRAQTMSNGVENVFVLNSNDEVEQFQWAGPTAGWHRYTFPGYPKLKLFTSLSQGDSVSLTGINENGQRVYYTYTSAGWRAGTY